MIIDKSTATSFTMYWFDTASPYSELFYYTQKVFFESGLLTKWEEQSFEGTRTKDRADNRHMLGFYRRKPGLITLTELTLIWVVWLIGVAVSFLLFVLELAVQNKRYFV